MPKIAIAIISGALAGVFGFLIGALFTAPQNKEMEELVTTKTQLTQQVQTLQQENKKLTEGSVQLNKQVRDLKDKLLKAYEVEKETQIF